MKKKTLVLRKLRIWPTLKKYEMATERRVVVAACHGTRTFTNDHPHASGMLTESNGMRQQPPEKKIIIKQR